jgi:TRAP-type C4-dicarboxylate transport system permease small subunit
MSNNSAIPTLIRLLDWVLYLIALVGGGVTLVFIMVLSTFNVLVMRKALNAPIQGVEDLLIQSLVVLVAFAIPFGGRTGAHIEIEVFESRMSKGFARWSLLVLRVVAGVLMIVMSYQLIHAGQNATKFGETTQQLLISYEPFYYLLAVCIGLYALVLISDVMQLILFGEIKDLKIGAPL